MTNQLAMTQYLQWFIQGLLQKGVNKVVISPGSRSTPLALLFHRHKAMQTYVAVDERSAGFFALGLSKTSEEPVILLCTSGTAAANYYPAICEAKASRIPLIVLTTDRPHELRQIGAPQAMDQLELFRNHVKLFVDMALPEATKEMLDYAYWQGIRAVDTAMQVPKAPVHLNFPLREPLLPDLDLAWPKEKSTTLHSGKQCLSNQQLEIIANDWQGKKGVFVIGGSHSPQQVTSLLKVANQLNWPVIGDPLTNILSMKNQENVIHYSDLFIQESKLIPEIIVRIGQLLVSKNIMLWMKELKQSDIYFVDENAQWQEPLKQAEIVIHGEMVQFFQDILPLVKKDDSYEWLASWQIYMKKVEEVWKQLPDSQGLNETSASRLIHQTMEEDGQLFVSNSNSVRYLDRFAGEPNGNYHLYGNRGVNGIDGVVSTALGMCAVYPEKQNILLIGDLALYHDMNGLLIAKQYELPLTVIVFNNNGGGIFSYLSQSTLDESDFEPLFGTPTDLSFEKVAQLYEADYQKVTTLQELSTAMKASIVNPSFQIIEIVGNREENVQLHQQMITALKE